MEACRLSIMTPQSETLGREFEGSRYFRVIERTDNYRAIELAMEQRRAARSNHGKACEWKDRSGAN